MSAGPLASRTGPAPVPAPSGSSLLAAFDAIGVAALAAGTRLELAVCREAALMLAGNFRFATEDVDIAELAEPWPD